MVEIELSYKVHWVRHVLVVALVASPSETMASAHVLHCS